MKRMMFAFALLLGLGQAQAAPVSPVPQAADKARAEVKYQKLTKYDFDDDKVVGDILMPDGVAVDGTLKAKHKSLLKPRQNFVAEMIKSAESL